MELATIHALEIPEVIAPYISWGLLVYVTIQRFARSADELGFLESVSLDQNKRDRANYECELVAKAFKADRVYFWAGLNGQVYLDKDTKKTLKGYAEWYNKDKGLDSVLTILREASLDLFDRNLKALFIQDKSLFQVAEIEGRDHYLIQGKNGGELRVYEKAVLSPDEAKWDDETAHINVELGFNSLAFCQILNSKGKFVGVLVVGWLDPQDAEKIKMTLFKQQTKNFYRPIEEISRGFKKKKFRKVIKGLGQRDE